jgi:hypothetical protein
MKIRPVEAALFYAAGRADRRDQVNSRFSQFCEKRLIMAVYIEKIYNTTGKGALGDVLLCDVLKNLFTSRYNTVLLCSHRAY